MKKGAHFVIISIFIVSRFFVDFDYYCKFTFRLGVVSILVRVCVCAYNFPALQAAKHKAYIYKFAYVENHNLRNTHKHRQRA